MWLAESKMLRLRSVSFYLKEYGNNLALHRIKWEKITFFPGDQGSAAPWLSKPCSGFDPPRKGREELQKEATLRCPSQKSS